MQNLEEGNRAKALMVQVSNLSFLYAPSFFTRL
jgi:hypothetical protein